MKERTRSFLRHPLVAGILGTFIGGLLTFHFTATIVENATVELMSRRLEIVEENDTLEVAINKVNKEVEDKNADIEEKKAELKKKDQEIAELTEKLNDDTEIKKFDAQIKVIQQEKDNLQRELDKLKEEKDKLQANYDELMEKGYEEYLISKQTMPISLSNIESLKNEGVRIDQTGSVSVGGVAFSYFIDTLSHKEAYIEYNLDKKYSQFKGKAFISKWAYETFDANDPVIGNASISIQVKYNNSDDYQEIDNVSGLTADSDPVEIGGSLMGVTRLKIVFRGGGGQHIGGSIIRLGEPVLYKAA